MVKQISAKEKQKTVSEFLLFVVSRNDYSLLKDFCSVPQKMFLRDVQRLLRMYKKMLRQKNVPESAGWVENFFNNHLIIPQGIHNASDVRGWNNALCHFWQLIGCKNAADKVMCNELAYDWWRATMNVHHAVGNVFNVVKSTNIATAESWRGVFPVKRLVQDGCFGILLHCGEIEALIEAGQAGFVISYLNKFDIAKVTDPRIRVIVCSWAALVPEEELFKFLKQSPEKMSELSKFRIFASHPKGLDCLVKEDCFGLIASMESSFKSIVANYPYEFGKIQSREHYAATLGYALDEKI